MSVRVVFIFGTRPEAIKIAPVVEELRILDVFPRIVCTNQHISLLSGTPAETVLKESVSLGMPSEGSIFGWVHNAAEALVEHLVAPCHVVVQGDTMSAFAGATTAASMFLPLHHIEAGVRSFASEPWPEEDIRTAISGLADFHYCATAQNAINLQKEGIPTESVSITGNPVVTSLLELGIAPCAASDPPTILVTLHRRELRESPAFPTIISALFKAMECRPAVRFLWPVHPAMNGIIMHAKKPKNLDLVAPLSYTDFVVRLSTALGLLTDSGGAVEEAATLGVPTVVFRRYSDRPEAEEAGIAVRITPTAFMPSTALHTLIEGSIKREPHSLYGDRKSAFRIASHIKKALS